MTRDAAIARVAELRAVTIARGATPAEAATAGALADELAARHGLGRTAAGRSALASHAASARSDRRSARSLRFVAFA